MSTGTKLRFVASEHQAILRDYLSAEGVVLVMDDALEKQLIKDGFTDNQRIYYEFGGVPDIDVDIVTNPEHSFFDNITPF